MVWEADSAKGAAVWIPPGLFGIWDQHPWNRPRIHARTVDGGARYDRFWRWVDAHTPDLAADSIALDPPTRGHGYGAALIRARLARAQADGIGAFLSTGTERNVSIYVRCGFNVVGEGDAPGEGGPHIWLMRWDPPPKDSHPADPPGGAKGPVRTTPDGPSGAGCPTATTGGSNYYNLS